MEIIICEYFNISLDQLTGKVKKRQYVTARHFTFLFYKEMTNLSLADIGAKCNKDHATALHGIKKIRNYIETEKKTRSQYFDLVELINAYYNNKLLKTLEQIVKL